MKVIGFDCGGVLLTDSWNPRVTAREFNIPQSELLSRIEENHKPLERGIISEHDFLTRVLKDYELSIEVVKKKIRKSMRVLFPENFDLIKELRENYEIVMMNNECQDWNAYRVRRFKLNSLFDRIFSSCDLGRAKPDKAYYRVVLEKLGIKPRDLVFIDNIKENVKSAEELGINSIHFRSPSQLKRRLAEIGIKM